MGNRVEELESEVASLQATVDGLTEELVETKERLRQLEAEPNPESERETDGAVDDGESAHAEFVPNADRTAAAPETAADDSAETATVDGSTDDASTGATVDGGDDTDVYVVGDDESHGLTDHTEVGDDDGGGVEPAEAGPEVDRSDSDDGMSGEDGGGDDSDGGDDIIVA